MNIGIIVHSFTGNTLQVAEKIKENLINKGHTVNIEQVKAVNENPHEVTEITLETIPNTENYNYIIFGAMVRGFCLSPVMKKYLEQIDSLNNKTIGCYVTQRLPYAIFGGNRSIKIMKNICKQKCGNVKMTAIANWSPKKKDKSIQNVVEVMQF